VWLFIIVNYYYSFSGTISSITAGVVFSIVGGGGTQHGFIQSLPQLFTFFLQHPFFAFLLQEDLLLLEHPFLSFLLQEDLLLLEHPFLSDLEHFDLDLQHDFLSEDLEQLFFSDLEQDFFFSPLQQVPFVLFGQVSSHTFPVLAHFFTSSLATVFEGNKDCALTLAIPIKNTANNTIDNFFILNSLIYVWQI